MFQFEESIRGRDGRCHWQPWKDQHEEEQVLELILRLSEAVHTSPTKLPETLVHDGNLASHCPWFSETEKRKPERHKLLRLHELSQRMNFITVCFILVCYFIFKILESSYAAPVGLMPLAQASSCFSIPNSWDV